MFKKRLEELVKQRAEAVQRREALAEELEGVRRQVSVLDGALLAYQEMAEAQEGQEQGRDADETAEA